MERIDPYLVDVRFVAAENAAAKLTRGITTRPTSWEALIAVAQRVLGHYQNEGRAINAEVSLIYGERGVPLIAAARILSAACDEISKELINPNPLDSEDLETQMQALSWLAASAYAASGNFASASAVLKAIEASEQIADNPYRRVCFALLNPNNIGPAIELAKPGAFDTHFLELLNEFLATGNDGALHSNYQKLSIVLCSNVLRFSTPPYCDRRDSHCVIKGYSQQWLPYVNILF